TIMSLDERQAKALGVPVAAVRMLVVILVAVVTASVVSRVGVLSFVGLAAASVVNVVAIRPIGQRLMAGFAFGAMLLWLTNNIVMLLSPWFKALLNITLPVGSVTGILGAGLIIWLVIRQSKQPMIAEQSPSLLASKRRYFGGGFWAVAVGLLLLVTVSVL
ncbi:iron chelate uptake ABC transporter family permease subunit, partial [Pseudomonas mosselii]|uniref:iron chelate uptake ABC transporter family permease subunit n=1 Tax=Pseudomonas mosselii TaxID=78327 RepID=UPI001BD20099